jgi:hypothetical protein
MAIVDFFGVPYVVDVPDGYTRKASFQNEYGETLVLLGKMDGPKLSSLLLMHSDMDWEQVELLAPNLAVLNQNETAVINALRAGWEAFS